MRAIQKNTNLARFEFPEFGRLLITVFIIAIYIFMGRAIAYSGEQLLILFIAIVFVIICFTKTWTGLVLLLFLSPFYGFVRYTLGISEPYMLWKELAVIALTAGWLIREVLVEKKRPISSPANLPLLLFLSVVIIQLIRAPNIVQGLFGLRIFAIYIPIYFVTANLCLTKKQLQSVVSMVLAIAVVTAIYGIWQYFAGLVGLRSLGLANVGSNLETMGQLRVFSTFAGPEYFGLYMVLAIIIGAALLVSNIPKNNKIILAISISAMSIGLIFTLVRIDWFLLAVGLAFLIVLAKKPRFAVLLLITVIFVAAVFPPFVAKRAGISFSREDQSYLGRQEVFLMWNIPNIITHPLGVGLGSTSGRAVYMRVTGETVDSELIGGGTTESGFVNVVLELGILGLVFLLWFFIWIIKHSLRTFNLLTDPFLKWLAAAIVVFIAMIALGNIFGSLMEVFPAGDLYFWFLAGLIMVLEKVEKQEASTVKTRSYSDHVDSLALK